MPILTEIDPKFLFVAVVLALIMIIREVHYEIAENEIIYAAHALGNPVPERRHADVMRKRCKDAGISFCKGAYLGMISGSPAMAAGNAVAFTILPFIG